MNFTEKDFIDVVSSDDINIFYCDDKDQSPLHFYSIEELSKKYADEPGKIEVLNLVGGFCSMYDHKKEPYGPMYRMADRRSALLEDITEGQADIMANNLDKIQNLAIKTRIADSLWVAKLPKGKGIESARIAIDGYYALIDNALKKNFLHAAYEYQNRLYTLSISLKGDERHKKLWVEFPKYAKHEYNSSSSASSLYWHHFLAKTADLNGLSDDEYLSLYNKTESIITELEKEQNINFIWLRSFYDVFIILSGKSKQDKTIQEALKIKRIQTYEQEADKNPNDFSKSHFLKEAIKEYRKLPGHKSDVERLTSQIEKFGTVIPYQTFSESIDITDFVSEAQKSVIGKDFNAALLGLVMFIMTNLPPKKDKEFMSAQKRTKSSITFAIAPMVVHDEYGQQMATYSTEDEKVNLNAMESAMLLNNMTCTAILSCINIINDEHHYSLPDIANLVAGSPFFSQEHHIIISKGIYAFLKGEQIEAAHFLILQLEECLRHILPQGVVISIIKQDGTEHNLTNIEYLLDKCIETQVLDENWAWFYKIYLVEPIRNLRNEIAHGKFGGRNYYSYDVGIVCSAVMGMTLFHKAKEFIDRKS